MNLFNASQLNTQKYITVLQTICKNWSIPSVVQNICFLGFLVQGYFTAAFPFIVSIAKCANISKTAQEIAVKNATLKIIKKKNTNAA